MHLGPCRRTGGAVFNAHVGGGVETQQGRQCDVARDGRLLITMDLPGAAAPITLIQHWNLAAKP